MGLISLSTCKPNQLAGLYAIHLRSAHVVMTIPISNYLILEEPTRRNVSLADGQPFSFFL